MTALLSNTLESLEIVPKLNNKEHLQKFPTTIVYLKVLYNKPKKYGIVYSLIVLYKNICCSDRLRLRRVSDTHD
jgi:hypothetical protein